MILQKRVFIIGILVLVLPLVGFPPAWKTACIVLFGILLIGNSVDISFPKKIEKRPRRKEKVNPVFSESIPAYPRKDIKKSSVVLETEDRGDSL
jgi:hypothetical protein